MPFFTRQHYFSLRQHDPEKDTEHPSDMISSWENTTLSVSALYHNTSNIGLYLTGLNILIFFAIATLSLTCIHNAHRVPQHLASLHESIDLTSTTPWTFNGSLFLPAHPSIARIDPGSDPTADVLWHDIELLRPIVITSAQARALGKDPATLVRMPQSFGYGKDAFPAQLDVFHQLHCLNVLREAVYYRDQDSDLAMAQTGSSSPLYREHLGHCVDQLYQFIRCNANTDLVTFNWMEKQESPFPDFNVRHQCRDFDKLWVWRNENSVPMDRWVKEMRKPEGVDEIPAPERYYELFGIGHDRSNINHSHL